ncbi:DUF6893 family small protein [Mycolicibacterium vinylchloridicum]|jgi:hypothetical protein|nr:hypothetical protein MycrhDRAFT_1855 [Mycolicibacterium rhodesiae JS60]
MAVIGWIATCVVAAAVVAGAVIGVRSIPDVQRYLRIRHM